MLQLATQNEANFFIFTLFGVANSGQRNLIFLKAFSLSEQRNRIKRKLLSLGHCSKVGNVLACQVANSGSIPYNGYFIYLSCTKENPKKFWHVRIWSNDLRILSPPHVCFVQDCQSRTMQTWAFLPKSTFSRVVTPGQRKKVNFFVRGWQTVK